MKLYVYMAKKSQVQKLAYFDGALENLLEQKARDRNPSHDSRAFSSDRDD